MRISDWSSDVCSSDLLFERNGTTLLARAPVSFTTAALGGTIEVPGIDRKPCEIQIRPGVRSEEHTSELQSLMRSSYAVFCSKTPNSTRCLPAVPHHGGPSATRPRHDPTATLRHAQ